MIERTVDQYTPGDFLDDWDIDGLFTALGQLFPLELTSEDLDAGNTDRAWLTDRIVEEAMGRYDARLESLGEELMGALERFLLLQIIDERWREHLFDMDYLREGIHLRGFAQIDPLVAYKNEAFTLFGDLMNSVWTDFARMIFNVEVNVEEQNGGGPAGSVLPGLGQRHPRRSGVLLRRPQRGRSRCPGLGGGPRVGGGAAVYDEPDEVMPVSSSGCWPTTSRSGATTLLVRERQEVQEVPRRLRPAAG